MTMNEPRLSGQVPAKPMRLPRPLLESDITKQVKDFMLARGWRAIRNQRTVVPGQFSSCEPGTPDFTFLRYVGTRDYPSLALVLWVELKRKDARGKTVTAKCRCATKTAKQRCTFHDQLNWRERERRGGVVWTSVDDIEWFIEQYQIHYGWLHSGPAARGQLDLLAELSV
jgi:hypothetical protein